MNNWKQPGKVLTGKPNIAVASGVGHLFGVALFGIATGDVAANTEGEFVTEGVVIIGKTSALEIAVGDPVYWDANNKVVNKTAAGQRCVGVATRAATDPSPTVEIKLVTVL